MKYKNLDLDELRFEIFKLVKNHGEIEITDYVAIVKDINGKQLVIGYAGSEKYAVIEALDLLSKQKYSKDIMDNIYVKRRY